jgi:hypothetical protein
LGSSAGRDEAVVVAEDALAPAEPELQARQQPGGRTPALSKGDVLQGKYTIMDVLGSGSSATAYTASTGDGRMVAIKALSMSGMRDWKTQGHVYCHTVEILRACCVCVCCVMLRACCVMLRAVWACGRVWCACVRLRLRVRTCCVRASCCVRAAYACAASCCVLSHCAVNDAATIAAAGAIPATGSPAEDWLSG